MTIEEILHVYNWTIFISFCSGFINMKSFCISSLHNMFRFVPGKKLFQLVLVQEYCHYTRGRVSGAQGYESRHHPHRGVAGVMDLVRSLEKLLIVNRRSVLVHCQVWRRV